MTTAIMTEDNPRPFVAPERLESDRFVLRAYRFGDGPALAKSVDSSKKHLSEWMPWSRGEYTPEVGEGLVRKFVAEYLENKEFTLGIWAPDESRLLGGTGFHLRGRPVQDRRGEVGMWIHGDMAGQGLGTEALLAMITWGFSAWPWDVLSWRCAPNNVASIRTAEKAGMSRDGVLRQMLNIGGDWHDEVCHSILREEWAGSAKP